MASPFTCLFNPRCMITTLEGYNTAAINYHKITINYFKTISNIYYMNEQKVSFHSYSTSNVFTAVYLGNLSSGLKSRISSAPSHSDFFSFWVL